jgi:hypothetical protein
MAFKIGSGLRAAFFCAQTPWADCAEHAGVRYQPAAH